MDIAELCREMDASGASDLFLNVGRVPTARRNGAIVPIDQEPVSEEAFRSFCEERLPAGTWERFQRERDVDIGVTLGETGGRYRINLSWQRGCPAMAVRRIPSGNLSPEDLHIPQNIVELASAPRGLILVTGATGSGKSTTLACMLNYINQNFSKHIVTIEDPVEFTHQDVKSVISQREIGSDTKDFATALRHVVRQNPDAIFIGEMRDMETIQTAISAAMTGHLVAATMHTMNPVQTIERILGYYPEYLREQTAADLSYILCGIVSQRLLPRQDGNGRIPAFEVLTNTPLAQRLIARRELVGLEEVIKGGVGGNMTTFNHYILELFRKGLVTVDAARNASSNREEFDLMLQGMQTGIDTLRTYSADPDQGLSIKKLLRDSIHYHASDLLLSAGSPPVIRVDGLLRAFDMPVLTGADTEKLLFSVLNARQRADFEEARELDFALSVTGLEKGESKTHRFRVNGFYQKGSVACAMRIIPSVIPQPQEIGLPPAVSRLASRPQGLVLVTGPTGSGKSTTLAALVGVINQTRPCHIITVEDPIEFVHNHATALIEQREVHEDTLSFANALKFVLRQDPDVILIGEMRDPETISTALTAAETGHLVFATLHTNDVTQSVDRIIDVFPADRQNQVRAQLAACLEAVVSQRLLPRNSPNGGRVAAFEVLIGTTAIKAMIRDKKTHQIAGMMETSAQFGMVTMERAMQNLLAQNLITPETFQLYNPRALLANDNQVLKNRQFQPL
ncbi:MAG: PilT/PilU family type 4a pilus ATPase [Victivallales bacterium]|nr:PilT/PilU family type 4a pilus ATPase [Victivallales bacterium]